MWYSTAQNSIVQHCIAQSNTAWHSMEQCCTLGMVHYGMAWYIVCCGILQFDMVWYGRVQFGMVWYGLVWYGYGMVWYDLVWCGLAWYGMLQIGIRPSAGARLVPPPPKWGDFDLLVWKALHNIGRSNPCVSSLATVILATRGLNIVSFSLYNLCILVLGVGLTESTRHLQILVKPIKCGMI